MTSEQEALLDLRHSEFDDLDDGHSCFIHDGIQDHCKKCGDDCECLACYERLMA